MKPSHAAEGFSLDDGDTLLEAFGIRAPASSSVVGETSSRPSPVVYFLYRANPSPPTAAIPAGGQHQLKQNLKPASSDAVAASGIGGTSLHSNGCVEEILEAINAFNKEQVRQILESGEEGCWYSSLTFLLAP
jgi:hypothetical protein